MKPPSRHALRAAVVASGLSMLTAGCGSASSTASDEATSTEAQTSGSDNTTTTLTSAEGASTDTSNASCDTTTQPTTERCCTEAGGGWDEGRSICYFAVPGPFVPPAMLG